jgi:hypothetical protein
LKGEKTMNNKVKKIIEVHTPKGNLVKINIEGENETSSKAVAEVMGRSIPLSIHAGGLIFPGKNGRHLESYDSKTGILLDDCAASIVEQGWMDYRKEISQLPDEVMRATIRERTRLTDNISGILDDIAHQRERGYQEDIGCIPDYNSPIYREAVEKLEKWDAAHPEVVEKLRKEREDKIKRHQWD